MGSDYVNTPLPVNLDGYRPLPAVYQLRYAILEMVRKGIDPLPDIQGRQDAKNDVLRALLSGAHPYLVSEEGTGKTRLAKALTKLLPAVPVIKGCAYNDDPSWHSHLLCPRCRASSNPREEYGVEIVPGAKRFSRIQGNEFTNEAKLLGLRDIQAISQGKSPSDPRVFTGTGIFKANRGILFIDELPAIRTRVQVLLHPVLEEKKAILEEYNWEHPIDIVLVATGNPAGFSHVNEVPRPLLDRLELIYMDLPEEETEREIMLAEKFRVISDYHQPVETADMLVSPALEQIARKVVAPWWIIDLVNRAVRHSRSCRWLDKKASIRGTTRAIDHAYASAELENKNVVNLKDAAAGLKLALRGRTGLRADLIDYENPKETFQRLDEVSEDLLWNALEDFDFRIDSDGDKLARELSRLLAGGAEHLTERLPQFPELSRTLDQLKTAGRDKLNDNLNQAERDIVLEPGRASDGMMDEYNLSALETCANIAWHRNLVAGLDGGKVFVPKMISWAKGASRDEMV